MSVSIEIDGTRYYAQGFAEEETLREILKIMSSGKDLTGRSTKDRIKADGDVTDAANEAAKSTEKWSDQVKKMTGSFISLHRTLSSSVIYLNRSMRDILDQSGNTFSALRDTVSSAMSGAVSALQIGLSVFGPFGRAIGLIVGAAGEAATLLAGTLVGALHKTINQYNSLIGIGANFGGSLIELRTVAHDSGFTLTDFSKAVQSNISGLTIMGGTASQGARALSSVTSQITGSSGLRQQFSQLGMELGDIPDYVAEFLGSLGRLGMSARQVTAQQAQLAASSLSYLKVQRGLSEITNQTLQEREQERKAIETDGAFRASILHLDAQRQHDLIEMVSQAERFVPGMGQALKEQIAFGTQVNTNTAMLANEFGTMFGAFTQGTQQIVSGTDYKTAMTDLTQHLHRNATQIEVETRRMAEAARLGLTSASDNPFISVMVSAMPAAIDRMFQALQGGFDLKLDEPLGPPDELQKQVYTFASGLLDLQQEMERLTSDILDSHVPQMMVRISTGVVESIESAVKFVTGRGGQRFTTIGDYERRKSKQEHAEVEELESELRSTGTPRDEIGRRIQDLRRQHSEQLYEYELESQAYAREVERIASINWSAMFSDLTNYVTKTLYPHEPDEHRISGTRDTRPESIPDRTVDGRSLAEINVVRERLKSMDETAKRTLQEIQDMNSRLTRQQ